MFAISKAADLNKLEQGGQLYWAFPFAKGSLDYRKKNFNDTPGSLRGGG